MRKEKEKYEYLPYGEVELKTVVINTGSVGTDLLKREVDITIET